MIQKVGLTITKNNSNKIVKIARKYVSTSTNSSKILTKKNGQAFSKVKRFFTELTDEIKANFRKFSQKEELPKTNKVKKSNISYNAKTKEELEIERKQRVVVEMRARDAEEQIKKAGHSVSSGDIDQHGYLTSSGKHKVEHPTFKGHLDDLDLQNNIEKHLSNEDGIHIRDKFTDWQHGKNIDDMPQIIEETNTNIHGIEFKSGDINSIQGHQVNDVQHHTESSLLDAIEKNHNKRNQLEQCADEVSGHSHCEEVGNIDEIPDSFFD